MTRKFIVITTIFLTILSFLPSHAIWAEPQYSELKFMVPDGPPFGYRKDDKITGIAYDIMIEALSLSGYTASVQITPLSRAIQSLKAGVIGGVFPLYKTAEREEFMSFAGEALFTQTISLFSRTGSALNSEGDLQKYSGVSIGVVNQMSYGEKFDGAMKANIFKRINLANSSEANLKNCWQIESI